MTPAGMVARVTAGGLLKLFRNDGTEGWSLSGDIARSEQVVLGTLVVKNSVGETVFVDAETGTQSASASPIVKDIIGTGDLPDVALVYANPSTDDLILAIDTPPNPSYEDHAFRHLSYKAACGAG